MIDSPSFRSWVGDMMDCEESPRSGSFWLGESGTAGPPIEPYFWMSAESGSAGTDGGAEGTDPYLRSSAESVAVCAEATDTSGGCDTGATASATATNAAIPERAWGLARRLARTGGGADGEECVMGWC